MRHHALSSVAALWLAAFVCVLQAGQDASPPPPAVPPPTDQPPPRFRTEANYVRVDAYPTRDGQPVMDLGADDFEVLENGAPQTIQAFEHVVISPAGPQALRSEASSVRGGEQQAANPRNRVFVFFLDIPHVSVEGSHRIKEPLIRLMDRALGPDDLVAVMTPQMSAAQITFGGKTEVIADMLRDRWTWGMRRSILPVDEREIEYEACYPSSAQKGLVAEMIARRRERTVLDALHDLVTYLGGVREERKAIVAVTEGWVLYGPNGSLTRLRGREDVPGRDPVGVDEFGKLRVNPQPRRGEAVPVGDRSTCDRERMHLANIDNEDHFRALMDRANRNNASFYPVGVQGLTAFDSEIGPAAPLPLDVDRRMLSTRIETLRTLAENTDGLAVVNTNDLEGGLKRMAADLTSYYLLGYYSSNAALDGGYRRITVKVKRPGVEVRARRGYRAPTAEEVSASRAAAAAPVPDHVRSTSAALAGLARLRDDQSFSVHAVPARERPDGPVTMLWVEGELLHSAREFAAGGVATIELTGGASATATHTLKAGERAFLLSVPVAGATEPIDIRARITPGGGGITPVTASTRVEPSAQQPLLFRRGLATGNRVQPAADFRFSRTERLRLELPLPGGAAPGEGRFLDRNGQPLAVPVTVSQRTDEHGRTWLTGDAVLSALGAGDYVVELSYRAGSTEQKVLTPVRVTR